MEDQSKAYGIIPLVPLIIRSIISIPSDNDNFWNSLDFFIFISFGFGLLISAFIIARLFSLKRSVISSKSLVIIYIQNALTGAIIVLIIPHVIHRYENFFKDMGITWLLPMTYLAFHLFRPFYSSCLPSLIVLMVFGAFFLGTHYRISSIRIRYKVQSYFQLVLLFFLISLWYLIIGYPLTHIVW